jgi:hypothetical protein
MRKLIALLTLLIALAATQAWAKDFLGLPLFDQSALGQTSEGDKEFVATYPVAPEKVLEFYKKALQGGKDIRFREFGGNYVVEDFGSRPWNKIMIAKGNPALAKVTITKDSWTWIIGMLVLRFFGVFSVLLALFLATAIATNIIRRLVKDGPQGVTQ